MLNFVMLTKLIFMNMKRSFTLLLTCLFVNLSFGQVFHILAEDPAGDPSQSVNDVERISLAIDPLQDSLWLQLDFHNSLSGDVGFVLGVDTDLDPGTGSHAWNGVQSGLNCEEIIIINRNSIDPSFFYGSSSIGGLNQLAVALNDTSILIKMKLSLIDADGTFNLIGGSGFFDAALTNRQIYDEIPELGWISVSPNVALTPDQETASWKIYPQPADQQLFIKWGDNVFSQENTRWEIMTWEGKSLMGKTWSAFEEINLRQLPSGMYIIRLFSGEKEMSQLLNVKH